MLSLKFRLIAHRDVSLKMAPNVLSKNMRKGLEVVGKRWQKSAQVRMRKDLGKSRESLVIQTAGTGLSLNLVVFSTLIQAFVDAYGLKRGVFPNFRVNSPLYRWALRRPFGLSRAKYKTRQRKLIRQKKLGKVPGFKLTKAQKKYIPSVRGIRRQGHRMVIDKRQKAKNQDARRIAYLVARHIFFKGIRPSHWNTRTLDANKNMVIREMQNAMSRAVNEINRG